MVLPPLRPGFDRWLLSAVPHQLSDFQGFPAGPVPDAHIRRVLGNLRMAAGESFRLPPLVVFVGGVWRMAAAVAVVVWGQNIYGGGTGGRGAYDRRF